MRIHDQNPAGAGGVNTPGTGASRGPAESLPVEGRQNSVSGAGSGRTGGAVPDRVSLSNLAASLSPSGLDREAELERLSELFHKGLYEPDADVVSERLMEEGLATGGELEPGEPGNGTPFR